MTKLLMISNDPKILEEGSSVRARMIEYGTLFEELHVIIFTKRGNRETISKNVFVYPTSSISKLFYMRDAFKIACKVINDHGLTQQNSVVTCQDIFESRVGEKIYRKFGIPLHCQIHTDIYSPYFSYTLKNKMRVRLSRKLLARAKAIRVVSERIKRSLPEALQARTSVLPIFADIKAIQESPVTENLREKYPQFKKIVLMASRLTKEKDIETAIEAFSIVQKENQRVGLIIAGTGPEGEKIKTSDSIIILPWVSQGTLMSYMKTCDVFLSTSLYEGYGLSMLEAHTAGATLVATDAGVAPELAEEVAEPKNSEKISDLLSRALRGDLQNKPYTYPYTDKQTYLEAYKSDIERALHPK